MIYVCIYFETIFSVKECKAEFRHGAEKKKGSSHHRLNDAKTKREHGERYLFISIPSCTPATPPSCFTLFVSQTDTATLSTYGVQGFSLAGDNLLSDADRRTLVHFVCHCNLKLKLVAPSGAPTKFRLHRFKRGGGIYHELYTGSDIEALVVVCIGVDDEKLKSHHAPHSYAHLY